MNRTPSPTVAVASSPETGPTLVRAIGRWTLTALVINCVIGSGIFGLPGDVARHLGSAAPVAYVIAALGIGLIIAVHAELASQFRDAGGPYLYAREAFGRFCGIQIGWFVWLVRLTGAAANANIFVIYLAEFWPGVASPLPRAAVLTGLIATLATVNIRGVRSGAGASNILTAAKLLPLLLFVGTGLWLMDAPPGGAASPVAGAGAWAAALIALVFAFGGFEIALLPMAEARNPRRDAPFALFAGLGIVTIIYVLIHIVAMRALPDLASSSRPLADAARVFLGATGAGIIALGAMLSTVGNLGSQLVGVPRLTYALGRHGDFPAALASVHPRFSTPHVSILLWAVLVLGLAIYGSFIWNALLSAVGRLLTYAVTCAALIQLRRRQPQADAFRLPAGWLFAVLGLGFCVVLVAQMNADHARLVAVVALLASVNWWWVRRRRA